MLGICKIKPQQKITYQSGLCRENPLKKSIVRAEIELKRARTTISWGPTPKQIYQVDTKSLPDIQNHTPKLAEKSITVIFLQD